MRTMSRGRPDRRVPKGALAGTAAPIGTVVVLYSKVRYAFAASAALPGRTALWRTTLANNTREELVAPFDTTSKFYFLTGSMLTSTSTVTSRATARRSASCSRFPASRQPC